MMAAKSPDRQHVDDAQLHLLVFGDEDSRECQNSAIHVETCEECQSRLSRLTGAESEVNELSDLLGGYQETHYSEPMSTSNSTRSEPSLDFLGPASHPELLGRIGRYDIERVIGHGGMGVVLKGFDAELNRPVAIKVLGAHLAHSGASRSRFARESRAAAAVVHENVVAIHNVEWDGESPFLVMHYVAGESVQARVDREGPLDIKAILRIGIHVAAGLEAAHDQGLIHRDVKPANILLENSVERALLTDFGLARTMDDASLTSTGIVAGTPHYMSPEQANGEVADLRSDLFSLGSVLYFMATGMPPFRAERAMGVLHKICHKPHQITYEVNPDVPDELSDIIDRLLTKKPSKRFASAKEVRESLTHLLAQLQDGKRRRLPYRRIIRKHRIKVLVSTFLAVSACGAVLMPPLDEFATRWNPVPATTKEKEKSTSGVLEVARQPPQSTAADQVDGESLDYDQAVSDVARRLDDLEIGLFQSVSEPRSEQFDRSVEHLDQRLSQMENNSTTENR